MLIYVNVFNGERREVHDANEALSLSKMQIDRGDGALVRPWGILDPIRDWNVLDVQPPPGGQAGAQFVDTTSWTLDNLTFLGKSLRSYFEQETLYVSPGFQADPSATPTSAISQTAFRQSMTATPIDQSGSPTTSAYTALPPIRPEGLQNIPLILLGIAGIVFLSMKAKRT